MNSRTFLGAGITRTLAVGIAIALGLWVSPAVAGKKALTDADMDGIAAGGQSTIIETGDGSSVVFTDDSQFNLNFDVANAQTGFTALTIQNVVGELQLLVNLNVLSASGNMAGTDQRNFSLQSWGGTLPIPDTSVVATVSGVAAAPCSANGSCVTQGGEGGGAPGTATAGAGGTASSSSSASGGGSGTGGISSPATVSGSAGGAPSGTPAAPVATAGAGSTATPVADASQPACTTSCTSSPTAVATGGNGGNATAVSRSGNGGDGGTLVARTGNGGNGTGGNAAAAAAAAPGGNGGSVTAPAGNGGAGAPLTVSGSASTSPGVVAIAPTSSASGDLVIRTGSGGSNVSALDNSQFNLTFTEPNAQSDLAALFISNVVGRSQMALNLNIASSKFTTVPFEAGAITGDITGTIKQVNTGIQFRGTPLVGATGVTSSLNMTINHQNQ